jgi:uncharacterized protein YndB with AHSA1/START domain
MLVRQVVIPASPEKLWDTLTQPEAVAAWFGSQVAWDLRPGGPARFWDDDGTVRDGIIDAVRPGRHLRFRWWPEDQEHNATSQVSYDLEAEEDGTRLTVTEQQVPGSDPTRPAASSSRPASSCGDAVTAAVRPAPSACSASLAISAASAASSSLSASSGASSPASWSWSDWDSRLFGCWAHATALVLAGRAGR